MPPRKRVLIVTYYFPPSGGPGVQRVLKFATYLRLYGWEPIILTVKDADYPARDESLLKEIPPDLGVYRTKIFEPYDVYRRLTGKTAGTPVDVNTIPREGEKRSFQEKMAEWVRATFFIPDARMGWIRPAVKEGMRLIEQLEIDALYSSSPPYTCAIIARNLKRATGLPWIAGFRDPWRGFLSTPKRWCLPNAIDRALERSVFTECDRMEVAWTGILKDFHGKYPKIPTEKVHHLPNGFDSADFPNVEIVDPSRFTLTYTGSMYGKRNPGTLLDAASKAVADGRITKEHLHFVFIGRFGQDVLEMIQRSELSDCVTVKDYMPHSESVRHLFQSDALLLIVDDFPGNEEIVPGKVYEYIGSGKPILTLAPEGAVAELVRGTQAGRVAGSQDVQGISDILANFFSQWKLGELKSVTLAPEARQFERRIITGKLAALLNEVTKK